MTRIAVFGYGSLVDPASAAESLGRPVELAALARLDGWRRRWSTYRDNLAVEKTFARPDGSLPRFVIGLNLERDLGCTGANGALIEIGEGEAERLDLREMRYDRVEVTEAVRPLGEGAPDFDRVVAYVAKRAHHAPAPPSGAVVMAPYLRTVEAAFAKLGDDHLALYRETTDPPPVEAIEPTLVRDHIPAGNPRAW
jgi:cation transport regulator ChaC